MIRDILITTVLNGWIVTVGCQRVVFNDEDAMLREISRYLHDPVAIETIYRTSAINAKHTFQGTEVAEVAVHESGGVDRVYHDPD